MSKEIEDDPWGEPDVHNDEIVCLLKKHFPTAPKIQVVSEAKRLDYARSLAAAMQAVDRNSRPAANDLDELCKAIVALKKAEKLISGLGRDGGNALIETAHQAITFKGDPFEQLRPVSADAVSIFADRITELIRGLQSAIKAFDGSDSALSKKGARKKIEAKELANALCRCFETLSGKAVRLSTNNRTNKKYGPCLDFVEEAFELFGVIGSTEDLVRAFANGGKKPKKN